MDGTCFEPCHFVNKVSEQHFSAENKQEAAEFYSKHLPMHSMKDQIKIQTSQWVLAWSVQKRISLVIIERWEAFRPSTLRGCRQLRLHVHRMIRSPCWTSCENYQSTAKVKATTRHGRGCAVWRYISITPTSQSVPIQFKFRECNPCMHREDSKTVLTAHADGTWAAEWLKRIKMISSIAYLTYNKMTP